MQNLDRDVRPLLEARKGDWKSVAAQARVSYSWLSKFANGHIRNPGFATLNRLHAALAPAKRKAKGAPSPTEQEGV